METFEQFLNTLDPNRKDYKIGELMSAFAAAGYPKPRTWIMRQEDKGNLVVPKSTTDYKKVQGTRKGFVRLLSRKQIEGIVLAFLPGGSGFYDYRKEDF